MPEPQSGVLATSPHPPYSRNHVPGGTRTPDPRLRRPMLYPAELLAHIGAGDGNRTHVAGLEGQNSTIELHPQHHNRVTKKKYRGGGIRTPGPMVPNHVLYQTEPHPVTNCLSDEIILADYITFGKSFFHIFQKNFHFFLSASRKAVSTCPTTHFASVYSLHS